MRLVTGEAVGIEVVAHYMRTKKRMVELISLFLICTDLKRKLVFFRRTLPKKIYQNISNSTVLIVSTKDKIPYKP